MILADGDGSAGGEVEAARRFVALRVAGVLVAPLSDQVTSFLAGQRVPVVQVDRHVGDGPVDAVVVDNHAAAREVTEHLLALGHRRLALLVDDSGSSTARDRHRAYLEVCRAAGVPVDDALVVTCPPDAATARDRVRALLTGPGAPTAVFAAGAPLAEGAWRAASDVGLRLPADLSLAAYDDATWMRLVTPGVTAVRQDAVALGEAALARLLDVIGAPGPPRTTSLSAEVLHRGSTAPPRPDRVVPEPARASS
ncbi:substrate-binding domain-containing protein [Cellulomonas sp. ATA003]|uniref:LacI family DNA-binding transcriptional regulator n=1 Tax=Cellulomonas sp. ATA003 TaxID=3073064 RepID=UPI00287359E4|nr:substrate-binding domain-containing protein [Cellulomonas sp. ATA003]WNB86868.1 substrate-binding domain-containing protein [Cellulomonas sp. ATA003]